jgi:flagellar basal-body rod modification protein FlgD
MSAISANAAGAIGGAGGSNRFNELSSEDFMKIIFTELQQQDPFEPNDSSALLEQLNSIRAIESDIDLTKNLQSIVFQNQLATAGNLIGKTVEGLTTTNERVVGNVFAVLREGDNVTLQLDTGWEIPADNVTVIVDPASLPQQQPAG